MIDHLTLRVKDARKARRFYEKALAPIGYEVLMSFGDHVGMGDRKPWLWVASEEKPEHPATTPMHLAFVAPSRAAVDGFYKAALAAGAKDNGKPGLRADYHPNYYAAFVIDPSGHFLEAVTHEAEAGRGKPKTARKPAKAPARKRK